MSNWLYASKWLLHAHACSNWADIFCGCNSQYDHTLFANPASFYAFGVCETEFQIDGKIRTRTTFAQQDLQ